MRISVKILMIFVTLTGLIACQSEDKIIIQTSPDNRVAFYVDVVNTDETRAKGLMFVEEMPQNRGMIFDFPNERPLKFWMKNTLIPLDMIFFNADGQVVYVVESATPHDLTPRGPDTPTCLVLEINGGLAKKMGIGVGSKIIAQQPFECLQSSIK